MIKRLVAIAIASVLLAAKAEALDVAFGADVDIGAGRAYDQYIGFGYGALQLDYQQTNAKRSGTTSAWFLSFGAMMSSFVGMEMRIGGGGHVNVDPIAGTPLQIGLPSLFALYVRPRIPMRPIEIYGLVGYAEAIYERTTPLFGNERARATGFSFGAGVAWRPTPGFAAGIEGVSLLRNASLGPGIDANATLLSAWMRFEY